MMSEKKNVTMRLEYLLKFVNHFRFICRHWEHLCDYLAKKNENLYLN